MTEKGGTLSITNLLLSLILFLFAQTPEPLFQVRVDGGPIQLHNFHGGVFGSFELARPTEVEIRAGFDVRWVDVRPRSAGVVPVIGPDHSSIRLQVKNPVPLTVEFNGDWKRVIHLFAAPPRKRTRPSPAPPTSVTSGPETTNPASSI